jgi:hypothetical protein
MRMRQAIVATGIVLLAALSGIAPAAAQATDVRFVLDFLLQGQQSPFVLGREPITPRRRSTSRPSIPAVAAPTPSPRSRAALTISVSAISAP